MTDPALPGYDLEEAIARTASAVVWRAREHATGRLVAVKRGAGTDPATADELREEAALLRDVAGPGVVALHGVVDDGDGVALVLELVPGASLRERIAAEGPRPLPEVVELIGALADTLAMVHARGVLHLDVKPGNVVFDTSGRPTLVDFGAARRLADLLATPQDHLTPFSGTAEYVDPAVVAGRRPDVRSDVYALGITCWHALAGRPPFSAPDPGRTMSAALTGDAEPLDAVGPIPSLVAAVVARAMARHPGARYTDPIAFAEALHDAATDPTPTLTLSPRTGAPPPRPHLPAPRPRGARDTRRLRLGAGFGLAAVAAAVVVAVLTLDGGGPSSAATRPPGGSAGGSDGREVVTWADGRAVVTRDGHEVTAYRVGRAGDQFLLGDWDCDGRTEPGLYRPSTGAVYRFDGWPQPGEVGTSAPAEILRLDAHATVGDADGDGCADDVGVDETGSDPGGSQRTR
jgi:hypothetical protein